jgi:bacterioferritin-associated ferredoxin
MMICHCMAISDADIRRAMDWMRAADPETLITPGKVYRALGKRADCGGCLPLFIETMRQAHSYSIPMHLRAPSRASTQGEPPDGRHQGHRLSQSGSAE